MYDPAILTFVAAWLSLIGPACVVLGAIYNVRAARRVRADHLEVLNAESRILAIEARLLEQLNQVRATQGWAASDALTKIQQIEAGLSGISRPLIRSLRNTVEPGRQAWWDTVPGLAATFSGMTASAGLWGPWPPPRAMSWEEQREAMVQTRLVSEAAAARWAPTGAHFPQHALNQTLLAQVAEAAAAMAALQSPLAPAPAPPDSLTGV